MSTTRSQSPSSARSSRAHGPGEVKAELRVATRLVGVALIVLLIACRERREPAAGARRQTAPRDRRAHRTGSFACAARAPARHRERNAGSWSPRRQPCSPRCGEARSSGDCSCPRCISPIRRSALRVFAFALALAIVVGALAGLVPALQSASPDLTSALKAGSRDGVTHRFALRDGARGDAGRAVRRAARRRGPVHRSLDNVEAHDVGYSVDRLVFASVSYDTRDSARDAELAEPAPCARRRALRSMPGWRMSRSHRRDPSTPSPSSPTRRTSIPTGRKLPPGIYTAVSPGLLLCDRDEAAARTHVQRRSRNERSVRSHREPSDGRLALAESGSYRSIVFTLRRAESRRAPVSSAWPRPRS